MLVIAGTGHRGLQPYSRLVDLARAILKKLQPSKVLVGMAVGWDMALAEATVEAQLPLWACLPCNPKTQRERFDDENFQRHIDILSKASEITVCGTGTLAKFNYQMRNEFMVDNCNLLLAIFSGKPSGTKNCIEYAKKVNRKVLNLWSAWEKYK